MHCSTQGGTGRGIADSLAAEGCHVAVCARLGPGREHLLGGRRAALPDMIHYDASKGALDNFSKALAKAWPRTGVPRASLSGA